MDLVPITCTTLVSPATKKRKESLLRKTGIYESGLYIHRHWQHKESVTGYSLLYPSFPTLLPTLHKRVTQRHVCDHRHTNIHHLTHTHTIHSDARSPGNIPDDTLHNAWHPGVLERKRKSTTIGSLIGYLHALKVIRRFLDPPVKS